MNMHTYAHIPHSHSYAQTCMLICTFMLNTLTQSHAHTHMHMYSHSCDHVLHTYTLT